MKHPSFCSRTRTHIPGILSLLILFTSISCGNTSETSSENGTNPPPLPPVTGEQIIADHAVVALYDTIPQTYIDEVKKMFLNILGQSHSTGYRIGLQLLMDQDPRFAVYDSNPPEEYTDEHLRVTIDSYGEEDFYTSEAALTGTKNHIAYYANNDREIDAAGFGWCWDMTWHNDPGGGPDPVFNVRWAGSSEGGPDGDERWGLDDGDISLTGNHVTMNTYLNAVEEYNSFSTSSSYRTRVFFTTGPVDTGDNTGESGYQRHLKHEYIRAFVLNDSNRILFDYADILTHNDAGEQNTISWEGHTFPFIHPDNMEDLDGSYKEDGDHIGERGALRLGKALWWMLARMQGWDGVPSD